MINHSPGVILTWQIAAMEAVMARYEMVERPHLLIGLCKLEDALKAGVAERMAEAADLGYLEEEVRQVDKLFTACGLDRAKFRRALRQAAGRGNFSETGQREVVHRSTATKRAFDKGAEFAEQLKSSELHSLHLLAGVLEDPGTHILQTLLTSGVDYEAFKVAVRGAMAAFKPPEGVALGGPDKRAARTVLGRFGVDLTQLAREGKLEPVIGRHRELLQMVRTLVRKTKNNPLLLGDPGVGKTALARELAARIAQGNVPPDLQGKRIIELKMGTLVAGTKYRGEFEERITQLIAEAKAQPDVILFLDEIHSLVGAGHAEGGLDAANMLKPALAQGEVRSIGATTLADYRKYFEHDAALARRFQPIQVEEPTPEEALKILEGVSERYEAHHGVKILPSALKAAVEFSVRYLPERHLPDKALDLLDEACTRVRVGTVSFKGEAAQQPVTAPVTAEAIAQVVAELTGIPAGRLTSQQQERLQRMAEALARRVIGQDNAVERVSRVIKMAKAGLRDPRRPLGVFLFVGPTGVGKTELAKALADFLFDSDKALLRLDMSEYMEKHSVSRLIGAPPGYIGHDEEGALTGGLRRRPYCVVLLDEIEKAHPEVLDLFLQLFDEGRLTDTHGRTADGKNAIFIMTSNVAAGAPAARALGFAPEQGAPGKAAGADDRQDILGALRGAFRAEFLNRVDDVILFRPLSMQHVAQIAKKMLAELRERVAAQQVWLEFRPEAIELLCVAGYDPENGARPLARAIERLLTRPLSEKLLAGAFQPGDKVSVGAARGEIAFSTEATEPDSDLTR